MSSEYAGCGTTSHFNRRTLLRAAGLSGIGWLTPVAHLLAIPQRTKSSARKPNSIILLWLSGGPSQLETFDPHPDTMIAAGTTAIKTSVRDVLLAEGMEQTAEQMESICLLRNVVSKEGDHERAIYNFKTGFRPDPSLVHPSMGAVLCHQLPMGRTEIPRHISILPDNSAGKGGYLGNQFDAFRTGDPLKPLPDLNAGLPPERFQKRLSGLSVVDQEFARSRLPNLETSRTVHRTTVDRAVRMMSSEQLKAFDLKSLPTAERNACGDSAFGRGCLAAARLVEVGVRCVEITLGGWDTHVNNHDFHTQNKSQLDPAFAGLIRYLKQRSLLDSTIVLCAGEFGRTPDVNPLGGRDHWPHGFSVAIAGGGIPGGRAIGETDPDGSRVAYDKGLPIADIHATILHKLGIQFEQELDTPIGRPMKIGEGQVLSQLIG